MANSNFPDDDWWLTHYTDSRNLDAIRETGALHCALSMMDANERARYAKEKREESLPLESGAVLRDQRPLSDRIVFCDGAKLSEFIEYLNGHVFFWPGFYRGEQCRKSFCKKYRYPKHVGLRCKLGDLRTKNPGTAFLFSRYNSGATPRNPKKSPRCLRLFQPLEKRNGKSLVEVVVRTKVCLPDNTEEEYATEKWRPFLPNQM